MAMKLTLENHAEHESDADDDDHHRHEEQALPQLNPDLCVLVFDPHTSVLPRARESESRSV
jgi:hypothetical protein